MQSQSATSVEGHFHKTAIKITLLYGAECWTMKKGQHRKVNVTKKDL